MARDKIILIKQGGDTIGEIMVDALWRSDAVHTAARAAEQTTPDCCAYEVWRDERKLVQGLVAGRAAG